MIINFHCKKTKKLFETDKYISKLDNIKKVAQRKLLMLHQASSLEYLRQFPNNQLEKLRDDRVGQWSIRINNQYRICFRWYQGNAYDVEITKHFQKI